MFAFASIAAPSTLDVIHERSRALGFDACSDERTGRLLAWLAGLYPGGRMLDLGTGTGLSAAWLLAGMDAASRLVSVDNDAAAQAVARAALAHDPRADFVLSDGGAFLSAAKPASFDLIFADAWAGKFSHLDEALRLVKPRGLYAIDDLLPQPNWPDQHQPNVDRLVGELEANRDFDCMRLDWSTGLILARRR